MTGLARTTNCGDIFDVVPLVSGKVITELVITIERSVILQRMVTVGLISASIKSLTNERGGVSFKNIVVNSKIDY